MFVSDLARFLASRPSDEEILQYQPPHEIFRWCEDMKREAQMVMLSKRRQDEIVAYETLESLLANIKARIQARSEAQRVVDDGQAS